MDDGGGGGKTIERGALACGSCARRYPIEQGIPRFIDAAQLTGPDRWFAQFYDRIAFLYLPVSLAAGAIAKPFGISRADLADRLGPAARVLEVSIGPGPMLPSFFARGATKVFGLDISWEALRRCRRYARRGRWPVSLALGMAEELPYATGAFDAVFHFGGINFFTDKRAAVAEMERVCRPGGRIVIADETERVARRYDRTLARFAHAFDGPRPPVVPPVDLVSPRARDVKVETLWRGAIYCISYAKEA